MVNVPDLESAVALIPLVDRRGAVVGFALVDPADVERLSHYRWIFGRSGSGYAQRSVRVDRRKFYRGMHRDVLDLPLESDGREGDHINGNGLDNRRANLRVVTHAQNMQNKAVYKNSASGVRGVYWHVDKRCWAAQITVDGRRRRGRFKTFEEAEEKVALWRRESMPFAVDRVPPW